MRRCFGGGGCGLCASALVFPCAFSRCRWRWDRKGMRGGETEGDETGGGGNTRHIRRQWNAWRAASEGRSAVAGEEPETSRPAVKALGPAPVRTMARIDEAVERAVKTSRSCVHMLRAVSLGRREEVRRERCWVCEGGTIIASLLLSSLRVAPLYVCSAMLLSFLFPSLAQGTQRRLTHSSLKAFSFSGRLISTSATYSAG